LFIAIVGQVSRPPHSVYGETVSKPVARSVRAIELTQLQAGAAGAYVKGMIRPVPWPVVPGQRAIHQRRRGTPNCSLDEITGLPRRATKISLDHCAIIQTDNVLRARVSVRIPDQSAIWVEPA
jgi:hypothetical protein